MRKLLVATVVGLVLTPSALAQQPPTQQMNPAQTCRALQENETAFELMFGTASNAFGKCVSTVAKTRGETQPGQQGPRAQTNPARTCRALRQTNRAAFELMFGTGSNAFGKCVSTVAKTRGGAQTP